MSSSLSSAPPRLPVLLALVALSSPGLAAAQGYDSHFHTGDAVVDLRTEPPTVTCPVGITAFEGSSTWSDPLTGALRFYTDGISVFDASTGGAVSGGAGTLGGNSTATQTSFLAPVPGTLNEQLYIFANDTDNVRVSVLDDSGVSPVMLSAGQPLLTDTGEAVTGLDDQNGGFWLVVWREATASLDAYAVDELGIASTPVSSPLPWSNLSSSRGTIVFSRAGDRVAVTTEGGSGLAWASFDVASGTVTSSWTPVHTRQGYSVAWSPSGGMLYYAAGTSWGWAGSLYQYDTNTGTETLLGGSGLGGVMLGSDDSIWVCGYGFNELGRVLDPDVGGAANTNLSALSLGSCAAGYNLSNQVSLTDVLCLDGDGDGQAPSRCGGMDCNDADASTYVGAPELCDGADNDCDGQVPGDEADPDQDGVPSCGDPCPDDNPDDSDGDGVCEGEDVCPGGDDNVDSDGDGVPDDCEGGDDDDDAADDDDTGDDDTLADDDDAPRGAGCGCNSGGERAPSWLLLAVGPALLSSRRRRPR